jgi:predicted nucleic acid-binding protein
VGRLLLDADELDFVPCSDLFSDAFEMFTHQKSKRLSFADAAIAHVAQERAGGLILTFDEEFRNLRGIRVPGEV